MSNAFGILTVVKALVGAEEFIQHGKLAWNPINDEQKELLERFQAIRDSLPLIPTLQGWARETAQELNEILAKHGFGIRLRPWPRDGNTFGVVAINDFTIEWMAVGQTEEEWGNRKILINDKPAFRLKMNAGVEFLGCRILPEPVIKIPTKTGDLVYVVKYEDSSEGFGLLETIENIRSELISVGRSYEGVNIPMVKLDLEVNIDWLLNLWTQAGRDKWWIAQALQEIKFAMNQFGARVKEATAIAVKKGLPSYYTVDGPFLIWIERQGVPVPLFMAHITEQDWKDPGDLASL